MIKVNCLLKAGIMVAIVLSATVLIWGPVGNAQTAKEPAAREFIYSEKVHQQSVEVSDDIDAILAHERGVVRKDQRTEFEPDDTAVDMKCSSPRPCETEADRAGFVAIYSQDFETDNGSYTFSGTAGKWEWGTPSTTAATASPPHDASPACNSGTKCWKADLGGTYKQSASMNLVSPPIAVPVGAINPKLSWAMKYRLEPAASDRAWLDVSNGSITRRIWESSGDSKSEGVGSSAVQSDQSADWAAYTADLTAFAGTSVTVTFHVNSGSSVNRPGIAIDDVRVTRSAPLAVPVTVSGQLTTAGGRGIGGAYVYLDANGTVLSPARRVTVSNSFGYFQFVDVPWQQNISISASSKRHICPTNAFFLGGAATSSFVCNGTS